MTSQLVKELYGEDEQWVAPAVTRSGYPIGRSNTNPAAACLANAASTDHPRRADVPDRPNILFLMADQLQAQVLDPDHPCQTPNLDRLAERGVRFRRAYTPNAVCSPARASLMTGLLPHNHGVLWVTHNVDDDQGTLREDKPHWAQRMIQAGYCTGYFGKWHVEHTNNPATFGWDTHKTAQGDWRPEFAERPAYDLIRYIEEPPGYDRRLHYAVTPTSPGTRQMGKVAVMAASWLDEALVADKPWCCFVSVPEPHDPFIAGAEAFSRYDVDALPLPPSAHDDLAGRPGLYRKSARTWAGMSDREHREAMACYYASVTEIDQVFGQLIDQVEATGQLDNTIVVVTTDHGELLGAHGMYCKNITAAEEIYNIPLLVCGPGVAAGHTTTARVGSHQLGPTLLGLAGAPSLGEVDGVSVATLLADPVRHQNEHTTGYAEYHGGRYLLTQRIYWDGDWKYVFNGFDDDELYNLADDRYEMVNLSNDPTHAERADHMMSRIWQIIRDTDDRSLLRTDYPPLRLARHGPGGNA